MTKEEAQAAMLAAIPATGEIPFEDFRSSVIAAGNRDSLHHYRAAVRSGAFHARVRDGVLYVSRQAEPTTPPAAPSAPSAPVG